jgi:hypothetical protein
VSYKKIFLWLSLLGIGLIFVYFRSEIQIFIIQQIADYLLEAIAVVLFRFFPDILVLLGLVGTAQSIYTSQLIRESKIEIPNGLGVPHSPIDSFEPDLPDFSPIDPPQETTNMAIQEYLNRIAGEDNGIDGCIIFSATSGTKLYWSTIEGHGKWLLNADAFSSRLKDTALRVKQDFSQDRVLNIPVEFKYSVFVFDKLGLYAHVDEKYVIIFVNGQGISSLGKLVEFAPDYVPKIKEEIARMR